MKKPLHPAVIGVCLVAALAVLGTLIVRGVGGGPEVQGTESMPPKVREAFMHAGKPPTSAPNR